MVFGLPRWTLVGTFAARAIEVEPRFELLGAIAQRMLDDAQAGDAERAITTALQSLVTSGTR